MDLGVGLGISLGVGLGRGGVHWATAIVAVLVNDMADRDLYLGFGLGLGGFLN